jgi:hypothetical protein
MNTAGQVGGFLEPQRPILAETYSTGDLNSASS